MAVEAQGKFEFVEPPPEELLCRVSLDVLFDPYLTFCCGTHLSQESYLRLQGQPCPVCREDLYAILDKSVKRKVLSLKVRCPHKAEGCEWQGELRNLEEHLNTNSECRYAEVDCPYACGERVQRRSLEEHKSQHCPLRPFTCQYCSHKATHREVTENHWPVCEKYPLSCPNECGQEEIKQQHLKEHLEHTCPLEVIKCEFSYAGCGAQLQRRLMSAHKKENVEAHLCMVAQEVPKLQKIMQQQTVVIKQMADQISQQGDQIKQLDKPVPPFDIILDDFEIRKKGADICQWYSPPCYSYVGGYRMCLEVHANGFGKGMGTHVSVYVQLMRGEFDHFLKWPFRGEVTVQLKKTDSPHYEKIIHLNENTPFECVYKPTEERNL